MILNLSFFVCLAFLFYIYFNKANFFPLLYLTFALFGATTNRLLMVSLLFSKTAQRSFSSHLCLVNLFTTYYTQKPQGTGRGRSLHRTIAILLYDYMKHWQSCLSIINAWTQYADGLLLPPAYNNKGLLKFHGSNKPDFISDVLV